MEKKYIGCKIIKAEPQVRKSTFKDGKDEEGYLVRYPDGYVSWSPKETFEIAYREITEDELDLIR